MCRLDGVDNPGRYLRMRSATLQLHSERLDGLFKAGHQEIQRLGFAWAGGTHGGYSLVSDNGRLEVKIRVNGIRRD